MAGIRAELKVDERVRCFTEALVAETTVGTRPSESALGERHRVVELAPAGGHNLLKSALWTPRAVTTV